MKKNLALLPILFTLLAGCTDYVSSIPDREVYLKRNINTEKLTPFGAYLYITEPVLAVDRIGFGGILIYHSLDVNKSYYAVDLACPKEANPKVRISPPNDLGLCKCDSCGEVYDMSFGQGTPTKGIAKEPLRHYTTRQDENDFIFITR